MKVTYTSDSSLEIIKTMSPRIVTDLQWDMQTLHEPLHCPYNRISVLRVWAQTEAKTLGPLVLRSLEDPAVRERVTAHLNMPTFVGFRMLDHAGLPSSDDVIFSSTATANSCNDDAVTSALHILGYTHPSHNITFQRSSTVTVSGLTAVGLKPPKNPAVQFDPNTIFQEWSKVAQSLATQFYAMTYPSHDPLSSLTQLPVKPHYDKIYHYGCINQSWTVNSLGTPVSNWGLHEHWNVLMTTAMMHHIICTLKPGGDAILKVRIFRRSETLGLTALVSTLFQRMEIVDVPDQICTYVGVLYFGMTDDVGLRQQVADTLWTAMDQNPSHIFCNPHMQSEKAAANLKKCAEHRQSMMDNRARANTLFLTCLRHLCNQIAHNRHPETFPAEELVEYFGPARANYFKHRWIEAHLRLSQRDTCALLSLMDKPWMREVC